ncbi:acetylcholine receptor subunit beta-like 1 isoform X2 [Paramacrobiotus metropolitanus]|uniref:acetylcholine receptor subunit beta-like 1 isoform X2 n=1 Tax=Paramacrobiotus metropolitanus TaxID=2943436 RepID=UPI002446344A|nr:acetylcholine receptor subunit beta-like 1 isoform X2 [Paramacrobiotus metropolitanus]
MNDQQQVMKINGYLDLTWVDERLRFDHPMYGANQSTLRLPSNKVWQPEIALVTTTDGNYGPTYRCNLLITPQGVIQWVPPFISKSSCTINPRFFPFDEQLCVMYFRSLTYSSQELEIKLAKHDFEIKDYRNQSSGTWDLIGAPIFSKRKVIGGIERDFVECHLRLRRKSLFYVVTILLPCVLISFLTGFVFLLPNKGKTNVCVSILFAIVVFLLLMSKILPPANVLPLLSEFLFFTFIMNVLSAFFTVIAINVNYRSCNTHTMPAPMRIIFLQLLPILLCMRRPLRHIKPRMHGRKPAVQMPNQMDQYSAVAIYHNPQCNAQSVVMQNEAAVRELGTESQRRNSPILPLRLTPTPARKSTKTPSPVIVSQRSIESVILKEAQMFADLLADIPGYNHALKAVAYIAENMRRKTDLEDISDDWRFMSQVIDRLLLWVFFLVTSAGSMGIILNSPYLFDYVVPMQYTIR